MDIYDVITGQWNSIVTGAGSLSVAREFLAGAAAGNKIVFAGGGYVCSIITSYFFFFCSYYH